MANSKKDVTILFIIVAVFFSLLKIFQYLNFGIHTDAPYYESVMWNTINGRFMISDQPGVHALGNHFTPFLISLIPIYYFIQHPLTLLIIHAVAIAAAVIPLYLITQFLFGNRFFSLAITLSFFFSRTVNYGVTDEFHMDAFFPLFFLLVFYFYLKKKLFYFYLMAILSLLLKESAGFAIIGIGLFILLKKDIKIGITLFTISSAYILLTIFMFIPLFRTSNDYEFIGFWSDYGKSYNEIFLNMLNPFSHINNIFTLYKLKNMFNIFSVYIFLPLFSIETVLLFLPAWFILYSTNQSLMIEGLVHYGLILIPLMFIGSLMNLQRFKNKEIFKSFKTDRDRIVKWAFILILFVNLGNSRIFKQVNPSWWTVNERWETAERIISQIPPGVPVSVQCDLRQHVPVRYERYMLPNNIEKVSYVMFDLEGNSYPITKDENMQIASELKSSGKWEIVEDTSGFLLMKKK